MTSIQSSVVACLLLSLLMAAPANAATLTVNSTADDGTGTCAPAKCTLRDAIARATSGDTIDFSMPANSAITLTRGELFVDKNLIITGPGPNLLTVQRSTALGTPPFSIFHVISSNAVISGLTIARGVAPEFGGGIFHEGATLTVDNCIISGNSAGSSGGGMTTGEDTRIINSTISGNSAGLIAGGVLNSIGDVTIRNSTLSGNTAGDRGGGVFNVFGTLTIANSTLSDNAALVGGGIYNERFHVGAAVLGVSTVAITNSTISGNRARSGGGGIYNLDGTVTIASGTIAGNSVLVPSASGGGIFNGTGTVTSTNTIIALNTAASGPDFAGELLLGEFNLIGNTSGLTFTGDVGGNLRNIDPLLDSLKDNGGPTFTHALRAGSPAIDKGTSRGSKTDQRGYLRPVDTPAINNNGGDGSDIGAYEVQPDQLVGCRNTVVTNSNDSGAGSLRTVIANACAGETITFAPNVTGAINLTSGELSINKTLTINGPGANVLAVQRSASAANFRVFNITSASTVTLSGLTIAQGLAAGQIGGGIYNLGALTLTNAAISGNLALNGGGIHNDFGTLTVMNSTISGNTVSNATAAGSGGGIFNRGGMVTITNSTISGNTANGPGGNSDSGGGIITNVGSVTIANSTIAGNSADIGGGIRNVNGGTVTSSNTIIARNMSPNGPDVNGPLTSRGYNLIGTGAAATISSTNGDQIGTATALIDPMLGPLRDNGGPTLTRALLAGSTAIDRGHSGGSTTDQRGFTRPLGVANVRAGDGSDIGAFEVQVPVLVVEFYNALLDHYFITWIVDEIAKLDAGTVIKGWTRTGQEFMTYTSPQSGTSPVCRYYIPPGLGDSHFFGRGSDECSATGQKNPSFVLEATAFMQMFLPVGGNCPVGTVQVYRVFSNRLDANHRYMIVKLIRDQMAALGWLVEGDGPDAVVMCAPQ